MLHRFAVVEHFCSRSVVGLYHVGFSGAFVMKSPNVAFHNTNMSLSEGVFYLRPQIAKDSVSQSEPFVPISSFKHTLSLSISVLCSS